MTIVIATSDEVLTKSILAPHDCPFFIGGSLLDEYDNEIAVSTYINSGGGLATDPQIHVDLDDLTKHANLSKATFIFIYIEKEWFVLRHNDNYVETRVLQTLVASGWNWNL